MSKSKVGDLLESFETKAKEAKSKEVCVRSLYGLLDVILCTLGLSDWLIFPMEGGKQDEK